MKEQEKVDQNQPVRSRKILFPRINGGVAIIVILSFLLGWQLGHRDFQVKWDNYKPNVTVTNQSPIGKDVNLDFTLFWSTWDLIHQKYIDKQALDPQKLYYGAIQGMVAAVGDPYTVFLPPEAQKTTKEQLQGSFEGVGMQLGYNKDKRLVVISPLKGTPAEKAGVGAGDMILKINSKDTNIISLPEAVALIRGPRGSSVSLSLFGENDTVPRDVSIVRDTIIVKSVEYELKNTTSGRKVAYLRVTSFGEKTDEEWNTAVSNALADGVQAVVVDVRNNPGGYLESAKYLASEFLDGGTVVIQEDYQGKKDEMQTVKAGKMLKLPLVILINKGSASASEILAGAIQDRGRGKIVGEQSFGKGTIQSAEDLASETGIHITTAKWLTPNGHWVHDVGLTPDVKILSGDDIKVDTQLQQALEILN